MAKYDTNGPGKFINAQGRVVKNRSGFEPMDSDAIRERIARGKRRIKALNSAIANMERIVAGPPVAEPAPVPQIDPARVAAAVNDALQQAFRTAA